MSEDAATEALRKGFKIVSMNMKDEETRKVLWSSEDWADVFEKETAVHLPPTVLTLPAVTREIVFSTEQLMTKFAIRQTLFLHSQMVEEWNFEFGFVPPNTTNTWENTITAASDAPMFPAHLLSGNLQILSEFLNEGKVFGRCLQRVYYDAPE